MVNGRADGRPGLANPACQLSHGQPKVNEAVLNRQVKTHGLLWLANCVITCHVLMTIAH